MHIIKLFHFCKSRLETILGKNELITQLVDLVKVPEISPVIQAARRPDFVDGLKQRALLSGR